MSGRISTPVLEIYFRGIAIQMQAIEVIGNYNLLGLRQAFDQKRCDFLLVCLAVVAIHLKK